MLKRITAAVLAAFVSLLMVGVPASAATVQPHSLPSHVGAGGFSARSAGPYYYAGFAQDLTSTMEASAAGVWGNVTAYTVATSCCAGNHALGELAWQDDNGAGQPTRKFTYEIGYTNDNGGSLKSFGGFWMNGVFQGYNTGISACSMSVTSPSCGAPAWTNLGMALTSGVTYEMGMQWANVGTADEGLWFWLKPSTGCPAGKTCWMGVIPKATLAAASPAIANYTKVKFAQAFGEVWDNGAGCTNMGDGTLATSTAGSVIGSVQYPGVSASLVSLTGSTTTDPSYWNAVSLSGRTLRYGGPGKC